MEDMEVLPEQNGAVTMRTMIDPRQDALDDLAENEYDNWAASQYQLAQLRGNGQPKRCSAFYAPYCLAHDYDHVLARREQDEFNQSWARMKNEWAQTEREQEEAAFMAGLE